MNLQPAASKEVASSRHRHSIAAVPGVNRGKVARFRAAAPQKSRWNLLAAKNFSTRDHFLKSHRMACLRLSSTARGNRRGKIMLNLVVTLLIIALIAAVLGFGGIAMAAVGIAKIIFFVALLLFLIAVLAGSLRSV
jgi:uncharacterized membrane protein YtjA (UPF0391 family)